MVAPCSPIGSSSTLEHTTSASQLSSISNEKLPTDFDRCATGEQPYTMGSVQSSKAFVAAAAASPFSPDVPSALVALFGVLIKR